MKIREWHKLRCGAAYSAILGLLFQLALITLHTTSAFAALASAGEHGEATTIICAGHGFKRVAVDKVDESDGATSAPGLYKSCPGYLGITGTPAFANAIVLPTPSGEIIGENYAATENSAIGGIQSRPRSRGPPLQT